MLLGTTSVKAVRRTSPKFNANIIARKKFQSQNLTRKKLLKAILCKKFEHKLLLKLTTVTSISPTFYEQLFCTKVFCLAVMCL